MDRPPWEPDDDDLRQLQLAALIIVLVCGVLPIVLTLAIWRWM
jgi:hypothetical protein